MMVYLNIRLLKVRVVLKSLVELYHQQLWFVTHWPHSHMHPLPSMSLLYYMNPGQDPGVVTSAKVRVGVLQLSVAVGVVQEGVPEHSIVVGPGNGDITGGVVSSTFMVCDALATLPHASVAVHVLVTEYSLGQLPGVVTSANVNVGVPQLSVAVGVVHDGVPVHSIVVGAGSAEITGGVVSNILKV
jgi:Ni,Fe-hydrogenase III small subunit